MNNREAVSHFAPYVVGTGPSLADAGPGARYEVGPPSVRLQWRYGVGGGVFDSVRRGARCDRTSCTAQRTALSRDGRYILFHFRSDTDIFKPSIVDIDTNTDTCKLK